MLPWSKSEFPCLSAVVAMINAPAVHFKQGLREKTLREMEWEKEREKEEFMFLSNFLSPPVSENSEVLKQDDSFLSALHKKKEQGHWVFNGK